MSDNMITIVQPPRLDEDSSVRIGNGTKLFLLDGTEITEVTRTVVTFAIDEVVSATIDIAIDQVENIEAHPMLSLDTVRDAAKRYGFELAKTNGFSLAQYWRRLTSSRKAGDSS